MTSVLPPSSLTPRLLSKAFRTGKSRLGGMCVMVLSLGILTGCANPGSGPDGGPYDETPPRIVGMSPALGGMNERTQKVTITFDEPIKIENAQEKVTVSPPQINTPNIKTTGHKISVELQDTLCPNTTYTIDFSDAIVDTHEGNALGNFTYYFSTGEAIDTMEVSGYVLSASDLEPIKGILVGLHANPSDTAFTSLPFDRVARTDGNGHFVIKGVAAKPYRIYALKDVDGDFKYSRGEMLAWRDEELLPSSFPDVRHDTLWADTVHIDTIRSIPYTHFLPDDVVLLAFTEKNTVRSLLKTQREPAYFRTFFTAPSKHTPEIEGINFDAARSLVVERSAGNDTLTYWLTDTALVKEDSLYALYTYEMTDDSTGAARFQTDTLCFVPRFSYERRQKLEAEEDAKWEKALEKRHKRGDYSQEQPPATFLEVKWQVRSIAPDKNLHFSLPEPAAKLDTAAFHLFLKVDSTYREAPMRLERDTLSLLNYTLRGEWRPGQQYVLNVDSACIVGLSGAVNRPHDAKFSISREDAYGSLFLILPDADTCAVVQLLSGSKVRSWQRVRQGRADFFYLSPGDYYLRVFYDRNGNGQWDEGVWKEHKQAEEVFYYPQKISVRANWDIEQEWRLKSLPVVEQKPRELIKQKENNTKTPKNLNAERERQRRN